MAFVISVFDEDHVLGLVRLALGEPGAAEKVRTFFAPEPVDPTELFALADGLHVGDGVCFVGPQVVLGSEVRDVDALLFRRGMVDAHMIRSMPRLKLVQRLGERSDMIDRAAAAERGVWVSCVPRPLLNHTAEHAILLALAWSKRLLDADHSVRTAPETPVPSPPTAGVSAYNWSGLHGVSGLWGRTFGIVGLGEVGTLVARLARAFGMRVFYASPHPQSAEREAALGIERRSLEVLLAESDFVSLHAADRPENAGMMDRAAFARMRGDAFFINTSRGRLVDEDALYEALCHGTIAGAGLDVHASEPRPAWDRFCQLPNVILTPHVAGGSRRGVLTEIACVLDNCRRVSRGEDPVHSVLDQGSPT